MTDYPSYDDLDREPLGAALGEDFLPGYPEEVCAKVFRKAWEDGHASGNREVVMQYEEIAEIVRSAGEWAAAEGAKSNG